MEHSQNIWWAGQTEQLVNFTCTRTLERVSLQDLGNEKLWLSGSCVDRVHLN